ncbi:MAG: hypothetical protein AWT59_1573 [Candidatus Gallionella acididurans]|uniref:Uncharacterized protein n=1 Tax=Candidatus Gallionella acididurans TaxID=1796491 RepID=A0A139BTM3_9PROT|nr:MAG: hypothetical protein AWT59_1573 [Candidatus Gallionella acididurans]
MILVYLAIEVLRIIVKSLMGIAKKPDAEHFRKRIE